MSTLPLLITVGGTGLTGYQTFTYDNFSRLSSKNENISGADYKYLYIYDNQNRMIGMTYPNPNNFSSSPFGVNYSYNQSNGYLTSITNASNGVLIWQANAMNEHTQVTSDQSEKLGTKIKRINFLV